MEDVEHSTYLGSNVNIQGGEQQQIQGYCYRNISLYYVYMKTAYVAQNIIYDQ